MPNNFVADKTPPKASHKAPQKPTKPKRDEAQELKDLQEETKAAKESYEHYAVALKWRERGKQDKAFKHFKLAADKGDQQAEMETAHAHKDGAGVKQDVLMAWNIMEKLARHGFAPAQYYLGLWYYEAYNGQPDHPLGMYWLKKAAEQDHTGAQLALRREQ